MRPLRAGFTRDGVLGGARSAGDCTSVAPESSFDIGDPRCANRRCAVEFVPTVPVSGLPAGGVESHGV